MPWILVEFAAEIDRRLLIPAAALAAMTNLRVFRVGTRIFGANVAPEGETGMMSKKYMTASVVVLLIFQSLVGGCGSTGWSLTSCGVWVLNVSSAG